MIVSQELRDQTMKQAQGAVALQIAFIGIANSLFSNLAKLGKATPEDLASQAGMDPEYVNRWCDAAYAFGYLEEKGGKLILTNLGEAFRPDVPGTLMPFAVQSALSGHMAERAIGLMKTGELPGEKCSRNGRVFSHGLVRCWRRPSVRRLRSRSFHPYRFTGKPT